MISPGTIRAAALVSKGMSPENAFREADRIDLITQNRRNFLKGSPSTAISQGTPTAALDSPSTSTTTNPEVSGAPQSIPSPLAKGMSLGNVTSLMKDKNLSGITELSKEDTDTINKIANSVKEPKVRKNLSLGNTNGILTTDNAEEGLKQLSPKELGQLDYKLGVTLAQANIDALVNKSSQSNYVPSEYKNKNYNKALIVNLDKLYTDYNAHLLDAPTVASTLAKEHNKKLSTYQNLVNAFLDTKTDLPSLKKNYDALAKELNYMDETSTKEFENADRLYRNGQANLTQSSLVTAGSLDFVATKAKKQALLSEISDVFQKRADALLGKQAKDIIRNRYDQAVQQNPKLTFAKYFEDVSKQYSLDKSGFGLGQVLVEEGVFKDYQDYIRFTNPVKYSKEFTSESGTNTKLGEFIPVDVKKEEDVNSWALEYSKFNSAGAINSATKDYRFRDAKEDLLFSGIQFSARISEAIQTETINQIKEREQLKLDLVKKEYKGTVSEEDKKKIQTRIDELNKEISYNESFETAIPAVYNFENIKKSSLYKNFAEDHADYLSKTQKYNRIYNGPDTNWYDDIGQSFYSKQFANTQTGVLLEQVGSLVAKGFLGATSEVLKFADQTVLNRYLGVPQSSNYNKRNAFYNSLKADLDVPTIIDERNSILAGKEITADQMFWKQKGASWYQYEFNPRAILTGAAETLPQVMMFNKAGKLAQSIAGQAAQAGIRSGLTSSLLGQKTANEFARTLRLVKGDATTAWAKTFNNSSNILVKKLVGERIPSAIGMSTLIYPETYNRNLERLEGMGVKDAHTIARNVALLNTAIEVIAENIIPNIRYLDDFAEKGTGVKDLLTKNKLTKKWVGSIDQYRSLYLGILGGKFSEKTVNYLARNSAEMFGQLGAAGRFYASRGAEEGIEEVFSEIVNGVADNNFNLASYRREAPQPLTIEGMLNAFAGGFFIPSAGGSRQMKVYSQNKKYSAMYDMTINADYYRNHINSQFKEGAITELQAASMLSKLEELVAISDEFGVQNLKRNPNGAKFAADLVNDPEKQFDYFKQILVAKGIEDKLAVEGEEIKEDERKTLLQEAEEASKRIDKYKQQSSVFGNMTQEQKDQIVSNTIAEKAKTARFSSTSQILSEAVVNADTKLAEAIKNKEPEHRIRALKDYRNSLIQVSESRAQQKREAVERGTYNPIIQALETEGESVPLNLTEIDNVDDLVDMTAQALVDVEHGVELDSFMRGNINKELVELEADRENATELYLDYLEASQANPSPENAKESTPTTAAVPAPRVKYKTIADLNSEQKADFEDFVEALEEEYQSKKSLVEKYTQILDQVVTHGALNANMSLKQQEEFAKEVYKKVSAVKKIGFDLTKDSGAELFDIQEFGLYLERNKTRVDEVVAEIEALYEEREKAEKVEREEVDLEGIAPLGEGTTVTIPELLPQDMTEAFAKGIAELEVVVEQSKVEVVKNEVTGQLDTLETLPKERTRILNELLAEVAKNPDIKGRKAMMATIMQVLGNSPESIQKTLLQMESVANNIAVDETEGTHMFNLYQLAKMMQKESLTPEQQQLAESELGITPTSTESEATPPTPPGPPVVEPVIVTEEDKDQQENQSKILQTSVLFYPSKKEAINLNHFEIQDRIITGLNKEISDKKEINTAIVDFFTIIEELLGVEVLENLERIFNEATAKDVSETRRKELRREFAFLFPAGFVKNTALRYIFDDIIVRGVAQTDVTEKGKFDFNATDAELIQLNEGKPVSIETADGKKYPIATATSERGLLTFVVKGAGPRGTDLKLSIDRTKDKIQGLRYPILGTRPLQFSDLNVPYFTVLNKEGKVQKYSDDGNKNEDGDKALLLNLPTAKFKANPTPLQTAYNGLRANLVNGGRVKIDTPVKGPSKIEGTKTIQTPEGTSTVVNTGHSFSFDASNLEEQSKIPTTQQTTTQANTAEILGSKIPLAQQTTVVAVQKMIEASKNIPEPDSDGYLINGKRYERQSRFVARVLGEKSVDTEQSTMNKERGAAVGNLLDIIGRDVLGGFPVKTLAEYIKEAESKGQTLRGGKGYSLFFTEIQFADLIADLSQVKKELNDKGWILFTEGLIVHKEFNDAEKKATGFNGVAGAMDILAVDKEGRVHIIDFKNKKYTTADKFTTTLFTSKGGFPSNVSKWSTQQTAYSNLGEEFNLPTDSISILAFASDYSEEDGVITINDLNLASNRTEIIDKHKSPVSPNLIKLSFDFKIIKQIQVRTSKASPTPTTTQPISNVEAKKADIEKRRQEEYAKIDVNYSEKIERWEKRKKEDIERTGLAGDTRALDALTAMISNAKNEVDKILNKELDELDTIENKKEDVKNALNYILTGRYEGKAERKRQSIKIGEKIAEKIATDLSNQGLIKQNGNFFSNLEDENLGVAWSVGKYFPKEFTEGFNAELAALKEANVSDLDKKNQLDKLQENLPEIAPQNAESAFDVLNSLGIDINDISSIVPTKGTIDPDALNPPPCQ